MLKLSFKLLQSLLPNFQVKFIFLEAISYFLYSSSFLLHNYPCARWHIYCYFRNTDWEAVYTTIAWNFWIQSFQNPKTQNCNCDIIGFAVRKSIWDFTTRQHSLYKYSSLWKNTYIQIICKVVTCEAHNLNFNDSIEIALGKQRYLTCCIVAYNTKGNQVEDQCSWYCVVLFYFPKLFS